MPKYKCHNCQAEWDLKAINAGEGRCPNCRSLRIESIGLRNIEAEMKDRDEIATVQDERGNNYGEFIDHSGSVDDIMDILENINRKKNGGNLKYPRGFRTALFYIVSKLVRLATSPDHEDSSLDLGSYAKLWLDIIRKVKG